MFPTVAVQGDGVAACCCVQLLRNSNVDVRVERSGRSSQLSVLVSPGTQRLLDDVFGNPSLLDDLPVISRRVVLWGQQPEPITLPHSGIAVSEAALLQRLWNCLDMVDGQSIDNPDWQLISRKQESTSSEEQKFGSRVATAVQVHLKQTTDTESCWVESLPDGWLFLLPSGSGKGSLLGVGNSPNALLGKSRLIAEQVDWLSEASLTFPAYPRIADRLCVPGWLLCGTAAMGFDPICGEGAGNAVREAILASAVLRAIQRGADVQPLLNHYSSRLLAGFLRHLQNCQAFYVPARNGPWWDAELAQLQAGIQWTSDRLSQIPPSSFRLVDFDLQPLRQELDAMNTAFN